LTCGIETVIVEAPGLAVKFTIGADGVFDVHPASVSVAGLSSTTPAGSVSLNETLKTVPLLPGTVIVYWIALEPVTSIWFGVNDVASVGAGTVAAGALAGSASAPAAASAASARSFVAPAIRARRTRAMSLTSDPSVRVRAGRPRRGDPPS
jgi:hypothetical protein